MRRRVDATAGALRSRRRSEPDAARIAGHEQRLKRGISLSIPERAKPGFYARTRDLVGAANLPAMLAGTVTLALAANAYELLCTAGFAWCSRAS
jgi:hypothetical protein